MYCEINMKCVKCDVICFLVLYYHVFYLLQHIALQMYIMLYTIFLIKSTFIIILFNLFKTFGACDRLLHHTVFFNLKQNNPESHFLTLNYKNLFTTIGLYSSRFKLILHTNPDQNTTVRTKLHGFLQDLANLNSLHFLAMNSCKVRLTLFWSTLCSTRKIYGKTYTFVRNDCEDHTIF